MMNRLIRSSVVAALLLGVAGADQASASISSTKTAFWNGTTWTYTFNIKVKNNKGLGSFNSYRIGFASLPVSTGGGITAPGAPQTPIPSPIPNGQTLFRAVTLVPQNPGTITATFTSVNNPTVVEGVKQYIDVGTFTSGMPGTFVGLNNALLGGLLPKLDPNATTVAGSQHVIFGPGSVAPNARVDLFQTIVGVAAGSAQAFLGGTTSDSFGGFEMSLDRSLMSLHQELLYVAVNQELAHVVPTHGSATLGVLGALTMLRRRRG